MLVDGKFGNIAIHNRTLFFNDITFYNIIFKVIELSLLVHDSQQSKWGAQ